MSKLTKDNARNERRRNRSKRTQDNISNRPRLVVSRSLKNIQAQIIDDLNGATLVSVSSLDKSLKSEIGKVKGKVERSKLVGKKIGEKVWRLPLDESYDKLMNSPVADMQNINYSGGAGSITAAQFLQRFIINKTPWAHLDIAGMAFSKKAANLNPGGATGFGVRLLNSLLEDYYE